jgi:hypothetical protein
MGFRADQEAARVLAMSINESRLGTARNLVNINIEVMA